MQQLSTLDTLFLTLDSPVFPLHGAGLLVLDPSTASEPLTFERVKEHLRTMLPLMPPFRRRLVEVPLGLDVPIWAEDPDFDLDDHVHRIAVPHPGGPREVATLVGEIATPALDRSQPLWDCWFLEGLADGRVALVLRMHHACIDGMGGVEMLMQMFSPSPDANVDAPEDDWVPDEVPSTLDMLRRALPTIVLRPIRSTQAIARLGFGVTRGHATSTNAGARARVFSGPRLPINEVPDHVHRRLAWADVAMTDVKAIRGAFGATVNDVALALGAGALRRHLEARGDLPSEPLVIANPVNVRAANEAGDFENRVAMMTVQLPTQLEDPVDRLRQVMRNTAAAKAGINAAGTNMFEDLFDVVAPGVASVVAHFTTNVIGGPVSAPYNACITNLIGPPFPLYFCGAKLEGFRIQMMQAMGVGVVIALISYDGVLQMSVTGSRELVPDVWAIAEGIDVERTLLLEAAATGLESDPVTPRQTPDRDARRTSA